VYKETEIFINGKVGRLEARYCETSHINNAKAMILLCHPDPTQEGSMFNKVISTSQRCARDKGVVTLRFNYRAVMQSEGTHDMQGGEIDDALSCANWLIQKHPNLALIIGGFSFGGLVAVDLALRLAKQNTNLHSLILIAPAVTRLPYQVSQLPCFTTIVSPKNDEILDPNKLKNWRNQLNSAHNFCEIENCGHFFHGKLVELKNIVNEALNNL